MKDFLNHIKNIKLVFILVFILILYGIVNISKDNIVMSFFPKSYVLNSIRNSFEDEWKDFKYMYTATYGINVSALKDEEETNLFTAYNNKDKEVFSCPKLFHNNYYGIAKNGIYKKSVKNKDNKSEIINEALSLLKMYEKYVEVSKKGNKFFAVTNNSESLCKTNEYEMTLDKKIIDVLPNYFKKHISDKLLLDKISTYLNKLDSNVIINLYIDNFDKIRSMNATFSYDGQDVFIEMNFNDAVNYWDDISFTCIFGNKKTVSIKSKRNHSGNGKLFTDETNIIVLNDSITKVQLKSTTNIDFNKQYDNVYFKFKGYIDDFSICEEGTGDLNAIDEKVIKTNINLDLKYEDVILNIIIDEDENNLKDVEDFDSIILAISKEWF